MDNDDERSLPGPRLGDWEDTIMNADSYGFFALIYRLREKQWEAYTEGEGDDQKIRFRKNTHLPLKGDWPGAP